MKEYDVIVVGAGHAGIEAALASAKLGKKTLVVTISKKSIGHMPCNPAIGGTGKGQLVREIDALGGVMGIIADKCAIQTKMLNLSKGPAVHSPRAQEDKQKYHSEMLKVLSAQKNLDVLEDEVVDIVSYETNGNKKITAVVFEKNGEIKAKAVIFTTGTYLGGKRLRGNEKEKGGPLGFKGSYLLAKNLKKKGFVFRRYKTGTPARALAESIKVEGLEEQKGDEKGIKFSFLTEKANKNKISCYLTYTNKESHKIVRENLKKSALYGGKTEGTGPRYCLCIEDKVVRFPDRDRHQVFLEREGLKTNEVYLQGLNINLPRNFQKKFYRSIKGLEKAKFSTFGYTIEYDSIDNSELRINLESKRMEGVFFAGQVIGSSGYEEAAASGLIAGINAVKKINGDEPFVLDRSEAYIGVLIDDLITKNPEEPYRIMTSKAEYRLILRQDNADERLTNIGRTIGLVDDKRWKRFLDVQKVKKELLGESGTEEKSQNSDKVRENKQEALERGEGKQSQNSDKVRENSIIQEAENKIAIEKHYEGYIQKAEKEVKKYKANENKKIPYDIDYKKISGLKKEAAEKLEKIRPETIGRAGRIAGVSPADITVLLIYLQKISVNKK